MLKFDYCLIDAGNSFIKIQYGNNQDLKDIQIASNEWALLYQYLVDLQFSICVASSVILIPNHIQNYLTIKADRFELLNTETEYPFKVDYDNGSTLGLDRIALALGAYYNSPNVDTLVISAGTCITYAHMNTATKVYTPIGISPGIVMRAKAMHQFTQGLPLVDPSVPISNLRSTIGNLMYGVQFGVSAEVNAHIKRYSDTNTNFKTILCGGNARIIAEYIDKEYNFEFNESLALFGLLQYAKSIIK
ncbi:MAG: type III pantothenate kinase [Bacteroidota bacterium]|nr:type III pantothenate kinase [Bacteroidota bacterium]